MDKFQQMRFGDFAILLFSVPSESQPQNTQIYGKPVAFREVKSR